MHWGILKKGRRGPDISVSRIPDDDDLTVRESLNPQTTNNVGNVANANFGPVYGHITMSSTTILPGRDASALEAVVEWLGGSNFAKSLKTAWDQHMDGTGAWFLQCSAFRHLVEEPPGVVVWGVGRPGVGKTIIAGACVMHLRALFQHQKDVAVLHAFLRFDESHSARDIFAGLLSQLLVQHDAGGGDSRSAGGNDNRALHLLLSHRQGTEILGEREVADLLGLVTASFRRVYIVLDGLDEAAEPVKETLLMVLLSLENVSLLITSRPLHHLFATYAPHALEVPIEAHVDDIRLYVAERVRRSGKLQAILRFSGDGKNIVARLTNQIQATSRGIFLIAHLQMEAVIHNANSVTTLFSALEDLPSGLEEAHQDTLKRIEAQSKSSISLAKRVFTWLLYANRKLTTQDVQSAMAVSIEKLSYAQGDMVPISVILAACCGLVEVRDHGDRRDPQQVASGAPDEVCFIHATTQDFLKPIVLDASPNPHEQLCLTCIVYMQSHPEALHALRVADGSAMSLEEALLSSGYWSEMLVYSLENWGDHAREAAKIGPLHPFIKHFLSHCTDHPHTVLATREKVAGKAKADSSQNDTGTGERFVLTSGSQLAAIYGLVDAVKEEIALHAALDLDSSDGGASTSAQHSVDANVSSHTISTDRAVLSGKQLLEESTSSSISESDSEVKYDTSPTVKHSFVPLRLEEHDRVISPKTGRCARHNTHKFMGFPHFGPCPPPPPR